MLECFWRGESAESSRWSAAEVAERERSWGERVGLFAGFPDGVDWERVALTRDEVLAIRYINWHWWLKVSSGTRLATVAADVQGRDEGGSKLVLLEGHVRLTAYGAFPELLPDELEIYLGEYPQIAEWSEW